MSGPSLVKIYQQTILLGYHWERPEEKNYLSYQKLLTEILLYPSLMEHLCFLKLKYQVDNEAERNKVRIVITSNGWEVPSMEKEPKEKRKKASPPIPGKLIEEHEFGSVFQKVTTPVKRGPPLLDSISIFSLVNLN